jgi:hypothetical protein
MEPVVEGIVEEIVVDGGSWNEDESRYIGGGDRRWREFGRRGS